MRKRAVCAPMMTLCLLLAACGGGGGAGNTDELALDIRSDYIAMNGCTAKLDVTADYGQRVYDYTLALTYAKDGDTTLTVEAPQEIAGITARLTGGSAVLEYDGVSLETGPLDTSGLSPIGCAPYLLSCAREAFIAESGLETVGESETLRCTYRDPDSTPGTGTEVSLWFDTNTHAPVQGEILSDGAQIIKCTVTDFAMT